MSEAATCELCGEPMPAGETMFKFHGYSGNCPKPPLPREVKPTLDEQTARLADALTREALLTLDRDRLTARVAELEAEFASVLKSREDVILSNHAIMAQRDKLQAFKGWVHSWLDAHGVPADPLPEKTAETGCRISGRMEWLWAKYVAAAA